MYRIIKEKGFITLEAAIFLPLFIIGVLTIAYLMKFIYAQENILYSICDEAKKVSRNTYVIQADPFFPGRMESRLEKENSDVATVQTKKFYYLYQQNGLNDLIQYRVDYWMDIRLPIKFYEGFSGSETVLFRGLTGSRKSSEGATFEEMEKEKPSIRVWIFLAAGERFHKRACSTIIVYPTQTILTNELKRMYRPCPVCGTKRNENGSLVYCFYKSGEAYHTGECPTVDKYVVETEKETAIKNGYSPCRLCGGS